MPSPPSITGRLYDRFGPKWVVVVSTILFSAGYLLMATMTNLWQFLLFYGVLAAAGLGGTTTPLFGALLSKWFETRRGMAISLGMAGTSLGQFALVPLFTAVLLAHGWRTTVVLIGVISLGCEHPAHASGDTRGPGRTRPGAVRSCHGGVGPRGRKVGRPFRWNRAD